MSTPYARSQLASVTARGGAWLIDMVAGLAVAAVVSLAVGAVSAVLADLAFLLVTVGWYVVSEAVWGYTPGKWIVGIEVVDTNGTISPPSAPSSGTSPRSSAVPRSC
jgi:uncharacterized RDD family membrane protein YckC